MKRNAPFFLFLLLSFSAFLCSQGIREPVWAGAGKFYEANPDVLSRHLEYLFKTAEGASRFSGNILALIAPHAGYVYSGRVAASAYSLVQGKNYQTVIILAPSHHHRFKGCSIYLKGGYKTPLGLVPIDEDLAANLSKASGFKYIARAHQQEHSVEVQIPFIQKSLPKAKIVPVVMGIATKKTISTLAEALSEVCQGGKTLILASTDLSHYFPKTRANKTDADTISLIQSLKINTLLRKLERGENIMCGGGPVCAMLLYAQKQGEARVKILRYADSSDAGGPEDGVVGYLAAAVYLDATSSPFSLSSDEKKLLLRLAQTAIEEFILDKKILNPHTQNISLQEKRGAFVTLKKKGRLRGCIGFIKPVFPLYETVIQAAIYAACRDQRFPPVTAEELKDIQIEVSVLTPLKKINNPHLVQIGKHGLFISKGNRSGLLLPQVPVEYKWSRDTFLQQACLKAGLPRDAWKQGADLYIFEAIVFH